jgi:hypothetical protein
MATRIIRDGVEYVSTTIQMPASLRERAKKAKIPFAKTLIIELEKKLAEEIKT